MPLAPKNVLSLYRVMLRNANKMQNYNFRSHAARRVKVAFLEGKNLSPSEADAKYKAGLEQLGILKRQAIISNLFPETQSIMQN